MININAETIMGLVIISLVALVMLTIGICRFIKKDAPVGFYNLTDPPGKEDITDIIAWNKKHGMILPLPFMIIRHNSLVKKYGSRG